MTEHYSYAQIRACLDRIDLSKPGAIRGLERVQSMLEAMKPPDEAAGMKILLALRNTAKRLRDDLVLIHRRGSKDELR